MRELQGNAIRASRTAGLAPATPRRGLIVATVAAFAMTLVGAFGTDAIGLLPRACFWLIVMEAGALIGIGVTIGVRSWGVLEAYRWREGALISALIALPLTLVVLGTSAAFFGNQTVTPARIAALFAMVLAVTAIITAVNYATAPPLTAPATAAPPANASPQPIRPRLSERLPRHLRDAAIQALQAEDHYLRVHTDAGSELILMRMSDAIPELAPLEGARTHRSWWVARAAIRSVARKDGRAELTLAGGLVAPVSRSAWPELRDTGWFDQPDG